MLYELDAGRFPTLRYKDLADQTEDVDVALSSANFHPALPGFRACVSALLPNGLEDINDARLLFGFNRDTLDQAARQQLDSFAQFASQQKNMRIFIEGHADSRGSRRYNQRLSNRRTAAVKRYLISKGVDPQQIRVKAYGEQQPIAANNTEQGRAQNRRVTVSVMQVGH
jgi:outer membrane protein OmpA-like peptidoglycan-associated protein